MLIEGVLASGRKALTEMESKSLLAAFRIPVVPTVVARSPNEALALAQQIGLPVAMKVSSGDIPHKSDVGGVKLNLATPQAIKAAHHDILASVAKEAPAARIDGVAIEPMVVKPTGREFIISLRVDRLFGPVIAFGPGGRLAEAAAELLRSRPDH